MSGSTYRIKICAPKDKRPTPYDVLLLRLTYAADLATTTADIHTIRRMCIHMLKLYPKCCVRPAEVFIDLQKRFADKYHLLPEDMEKAFERLKNSLMFALESANLDEAEKLAGHHDTKEPSEAKSPEVISLQAASSRTSEEKASQTYCVADVWVETPNVYTQQDPLSECKQSGSTSECNSSVEKSAETQNQDVNHPSTPQAETTI